MTKGFVLPLLVGPLLGGCMVAGQGVDSSVSIDPLVDVSQRRSELLALPEGDRRKLCRGSTLAPLLDRTATISGPIEYQQSNAQAAGNALFKNIEAYYAGDPDAAEVIRGALEKGARIDAFTVLAPYRPREFPGYNAINEPVFQVANFMVPLAHAYLVLEEENADDTALLSAVSRWGDQLYEATRSANDDFGGRYRGIDRRAHIAAGWASWGNVANNRTAIADAYRYFTLSLAGTGANGVDRVWIDVPATGGTRLSFVNATMQSALVAAHALRRSGAGDVYTVAPSGGTVVEGVAWFWDAFEREEPSNLQKTRSPGSKGVGWTEVFVHEFPNHPSAARMRAWLAERNASFVNMGGGPTTCLYRRVDLSSIRL